MANVASVLSGNCCVLENESGPDQLYVYGVVPPVPVAESEMVAVVQYVLLLLAALTDGKGLTTTVTEPVVEEVHPVTVWVTL